MKRLILGIIILFLMVGCSNEAYKKQWIEEIGVSE